MCFSWSVLYYMSLLFLVCHNHTCCKRLLRGTHINREIIRILYVLHLYLLSYIVFALVVHLYLLEHVGGFVFIETIVLSCFTYIILRVLQNSMVICFNYDRHPRLVKKNLMSVLNTMRSLMLDNCFEI